MTRKRSKRGQNQGSITERPNGSQMAQFTLNGRRLTKYFKTKKEANKWLIEMQIKKNRGLTLAGARTSLDDFFVDYLKAIKSSLRPNTFQQYSQIVNQHISPILGKYKLEDLKPNIIQQFYNFKIDDGVSERTVILIHAVLHKAFKQAVLWGIIGWNPSDGVIRPKMKRKEMQVLDDVQVRNLLLAAKGSWMETILQLAITTGMRFGELLGLKWSDLNWETRQLQIQRQAKRIIGQGIVFSEPKTKAGRRTIVLGKSTVKLLRKHWLDQQSMINKLESGWEDLDLIFPSKIGTAIDQSNVTKLFKELLKKANLPEIRFHDLRHTSATLMLKQGINPKIVQERLGHSDISMTLNCYSHVLPSMQEEAAEIIDEQLTLIEVDKNFKINEDKLLFGLQ